MMECNITGRHSTVLYVGKRIKSTCRSPFLAGTRRDSSAVIVISLNKVTINSSKTTLLFCKLLRDTKIPTSISNNKM